MTPEQLQNQKNMQAAGLTPEQQAGVTSGKGYATVPNASIQPATAITVPPKVLDTTNYNADILGGQATIDANNKDLTKITPPPTATDQYVSSLKELDVPSTAGQYATDYAASGIATNQQDVLAKQQALNTAQSKLAGINARLAGINAEAKAQQLSLEGQGRGISTDILSGQSAEISRRTAIKALPIQAEALGAQAEVQAAQGNVQLSQETLKLAQDRLNTVFTMHTEDAKNKYNAQKDLIAAVYTQASAKEKALLDAKLKEEERAYQERKDNVNNAQQWALKAMENGQASVASQITALDPKSPNYVKNLAALQGQVIAKQKAVVGAPIKQIDTSLPASSSDYLDQLFSSNIGGKKPTQVETLRPIQKTLAVSSQLGELSSLISGTKTDPILGALRSMNPYDFDARAIQATLQATVPNLARGVYGEVGVLTDQDIKNYIQTLPNIKGTKAQNDFVMGMTLRSLQNGLLGQLEVLQGAGYDISGFRNSYDKLVNQSNKIEKNLGITKSVDVAPEKAATFDSIVSQTPQQGGYFSNLWNAITGK